MGYEIKFPFVPPWEDLKLEMALPGGGKVYVFDTLVEQDPVRRAEIDKAVGRVLARAEQRKFLNMLEEKAI